MRIVVAALAALLVAGCTTVQPVPIARPLNDSQIAAIGPTPVVVTETNMGITKSWVAQNFTAAGASQGLLGVLVGAAMDGIANYAPSRRAGRTANELATVMPAEAINESLVQAFQREINASPAAGGITISEVRSVQPLIDTGPTPGHLNVEASYQLSEDATMMLVNFTLTYDDPAVPYETPYTFEGQVPEAERTGPVYRNSFTFRSDQLPEPALTDDLRQRLVESIRESALDDDGNPPAEGSDAHKAMTREIELAMDDEFSRSEISIFLAREWTRNNGALLRSTIEEAHAFIARYAMLDMNRTVVPRMDGTSDEIVERMPNGRTVRRIGSTVLTGAYVSAPGNVDDFVSFGNAQAVARVNQDRTSEIQARARAARRR